MKKLAGMFYGRLESYAAALDKDDAGLLASALRRNIYPETGEDAPDMGGLAQWMMDAERRLRALDEEVVETGTVRLDPPGGLL